jgi:hypothetical protein
LAVGNITRRRSLVAGPSRCTIEVAKRDQPQVLLLSAINCTRSDSTALAVQNHVVRQNAPASCL